MLEGTVEYLSLQVWLAAAWERAEVPGVHADRSLAQKAPRPACDEARVATQCVHDAVARFAVFNCHLQAGLSI